MSSAEWIGKLCQTGHSLGLMRHATQRITFAAANTGLQNALKEIFTVTGTVIALCFGECQTSVTRDPGATISLGTENASTAFIAATAANGITSTIVLWCNSTPAIEELWTTFDAYWQIISEADIAYEVLAADLTGGTIKFHCYWWPISIDGFVIAAGSNIDA